LFSTHTVSGTCRMAVMNVSAGPLTQFTFRVRRDSFTIKQATVTDPQNGNSASPVTATPAHQTPPGFPHNRAYQPHEQFTLTIVYTGAPFNGGSFGSFTWTTHGSATIGASLSEPYYSYTWWPIKDGDVGVAGDNIDKFTIDEHFTVPNTMLAPGN